MSTSHHPSFDLVPSDMKDAIATFHSEAKQIDAEVVIGPYQSPGRVSPGRRPLFLKGDVMPATLDWIEPIPRQLVLPL
jgi:hypothetical protein